MPIIGIKIGNYLQRIRYKHGNLPQDGQRLVSSLERIAKVGLLHDARNAVRKAEDTMVGQIIEYAMESGRYPMTKTFIMLPLMVQDEENLTEEERQEAIDYDQWVYSGILVFLKDSVLYRDRVSEYFIETGKHPSVKDLVKRYKDG